MSDEIAPEVAAPAVASIAAKLGFESTPELPPEERPNVARAVAKNFADRRNARGQFVPEAKAEPTAESPKADIAPESPKADPEPPKPQDELRHARTLQALTKAQKEALDHKAGRETAEKKYGELEAAAKANPLRALEKLTGRTFAEIMKDAAKGNYDVKQQDPELSAELAEIRAWREEQKKEQTEKATQAQRTADLQTTTQFLTTRKDEFPLFSELEGAAEGLMEQAYLRLQAGEQPDLAEIAREAEQAAISGLEKLLTNPNVLAYARKHPKIGAALGALVKTAPAPAPGKPTLSNATAAESPPPGPAKTKNHNDDLSPEVLEGFRSWKRLHGVGR